MFVQALAFWLTYRKHAINGGFYYHDEYCYYCYSRLGFLRQRLAFKVFIREYAHNQHLWKGDEGSRAGKEETELQLVPTKVLFRPTESSGPEWFFIMVTDCGEEAEPLLLYW